MILDPNALRGDLQLLEQIEKATARMVTQAIYDFRDEAREFFIHEPDLVADIGEDITREAMDRMGTSVIPARLFGKIDYKRARYVFHPEYSVRQALFVDSKAEKVAGARTVTIQTGQTSLRIRQVRRDKPIDVQGTLPQLIQIQGDDYLVTTVFVKYNYRESADKSEKVLRAFLYLPFQMGCFRTSTIRHLSKHFGSRAETRPAVEKHSVSGLACHG